MVSSHCYQPRRGSPARSERAALLAKRHAKLLRYQCAAEECMRAFAAIEGNEKGALELGRTLGVAAQRPRRVRNTRVSPGTVGQESTVTVTFMDGPLRPEDRRGKEVSPRRVIAVALLAALSVRDTSPVMPL